MKRVLTYVLAILMLQVCFANTVLADVPSLEDDIVASWDLTAERESILEMLSFVEMDKEAIGLGDADFEMLEIGSKIYRYILTDEGAEQTGYSYPIFYDDEIVMVATKDQGNQIQISTYEADVIREHELNSVALVYAADGMYLYDGMTWVLASAYGDEIEDRVTLDDFIDSNTIQVASQENSVFVVTNTSGRESLNYSSVTDVLSTKSTNAYYSCTVDFLYQNYDYDCWAATVAMVTNYMTNTSYSTQDVFDSYNYGSSTAPDYIQLATILRDDYLCGNYYGKSYSPTDSTIKTNMIDYSPVVGCFRLAGTNCWGHATVIDAYSTSGYIRVCDPSAGRVYVYRNTTDEYQNYYGEYTYESPSSGNLMILEKYVSIH